MAVVVAILMSVPFMNHIISPTRSALKTVHSTFALGIFKDHKETRISCIGFMI